MRRLIAIVVAAAGLISVSSICKAESTKIELGWGNLPECVRAVCNGGIICPDTLEHTPQRITAYLNLETQTVQGALDTAKDCAVQGTAAAGLASIIANPAAAEPTFYSVFEECMRGQDWGSMSLSAETQCEGW